MKVVFCWSVISGYMASCWRELSARPGIDLHVIAHPSGGTTAFHNRLLDGVSHRLLSADEQADVAAIEQMVVAESPDVVVMTGWWLKPYRRLVHARRLDRAKFIMGVDSPWRTEAQFLTRFRHGGTLRRVDHFVVTGERSWQYVARLGVPPERISRGMYGVDVASLERARIERARGPWPRRFLVLGRYEREKAIDVLIPAYRAYRDQVADPWPLVCCGRGPDGRLLADVPGVTDRGFVQPDELVGVLASAGACVIPSRFDPWPLALVESAAAGLPVICSDACGSGVEIVRPLFNGLVVPVENPNALAAAMRQLHEREAELPAWGERSHQLASAYSTAIWADRWIEVFRQLGGSRS